MRQKLETEAHAYARLCNTLGPHAAEVLDKILTTTEKHNIVQRWRICDMLNAGATHRTISAALGVSLCKTITVARALNGKKKVAKSKHDKAKVANTKKTVKKPTKENGNNLASKSKGKVRRKTA